MRLPRNPPPAGDFPVERATFARVRADLLREHSGEYVVIAGQRVLAIVRTLEEALDRGFTALGGPGFFVERLTDAPLVLPVAFRTWTPTSGGM